MAVEKGKNYDDDLFKCGLNEDLFSNKKPPLDYYFKSVRYYFTPEYVKDGYTFLDIGGSGGDFGAAIKSEVADIKSIVIDPDPACIEVGKKNFPDTEFILGSFPEDMPEDRTYDIVSMQGLFPFLPNWKETMFLLRKYAKKYINVSLNFKMQGTTVVDKDVSYVYYLDSGERVHQVIHNVYEFVNFCCIYEMGVKKIEFYGYHTPYTGHNFRCVPNSEVIKGTLMLELFENPEDNPKRMGGAVDKGKGNENYRFFVPEMKIIIDDEVFDPRADG